MRYNTCMQRRNILGFIGCLLLGMAGVLVFHMITSPTAIALISPLASSPTPLPPPFSIDKPPSSSLTGMITKLSGSVSWQSRTATQGATIVTPQKLQQGESLATDTDGRVTFVFGKDSFSLSPKSSVSFSQTLPQNLVFDMDQGSLTYENSSPIPFSVRALDLLTNTSSGSGTMTVDSDNGFVTLHPKIGVIQVGFNDSNNVSTVDTITAGETMVFDDNERTLTSE